ncbi:glycosyltransferase family 2 protein [Streptococcus hyovaginalis]|uniref:glycosyltransferase family 2 protein n=1 Tax=Streptococcus hyovaginalis TaxID=149015 RepID=UPI001478F077|nr:glycosyltransferase family 2 protein [Streptococcus hyovaginalis]
MDLISVIVPIYNSDVFLEKCLDSIIQQTYSNLKILLLNDGSSDQSARICESYRSKDSRIRLSHRKLGGSGVGAVRNAALSMVTGDYILFVDHDDWLEPDHISYLYDALKETEADIAIANFTQFMEETQSFVFHLQESDYFRKVYNPAEWFQEEYNGRYSLSQCFTVPWCKLYKASLFENVVYPEDQEVEDDYTTWKVYLLAERIVFSNRSIYYHRKLESSVTKSVATTSVFPLRSIEERVTLLAMLGYDISKELAAYRWRLEKHRTAYLESGRMQDYKRCLQLIEILEHQTKS